MTRPCILVMIKVKDTDELLPPGICVNGGTAKWNLLS
jgi:hypothetical protein